MAVASADASVDEFLKLMRSGVAAWEAAGAMLVVLRKTSPGIYAEIIKREPMITVDMLTTLERIGERKLHPRLLLNAQLPVKRLIGFPYDEQARLCSEPIDVVVQVRAGKPVVQKKLVRDCSRKELSCALDTSRVRTVREQAELRSAGIMEGNAEWKALSLRRFKAAAEESEAKTLPVGKAARLGDAVPMGARVIGRWAVRKTIGRNVGFERTQADPFDKVRIMLHDGVAVFEILEMP